MPGYLEVEVIIHDHNDAIDLDFLGLDPLDLPAKRLHNQKEEDEFCQRLLLLDAKWWGSEARFQFLGLVDEMDERAIEAFENGQEPIPMMRERRFVVVGWPSTGGLLVAEFDTAIWGVEEEDNLVPSDVVSLNLARTMDERCKVLKEHFKTTFYRDLESYDDYASLKGWQEKNGDS